MTQEALKLVMDALDDLLYWDNGKPEYDEARKALQVGKQALAQPEQEPISWSVVGDGKFGEYELGQVFVDYEATHIYWENRGYELVPVYTAPPQRPWIGLTDESITQVIDLMPNGINGWMSDWDLYEFARAVLAKSKELKNG